MKKRLELLITDYKEQLNELLHISVRESSGTFSKIALELQIDYLKKVIHDLEKVL